MNIYVISYADSNFKKQQIRLTKSINRVGPNYKVVEFGPDDIDKEFYNQNESILRNSKGGGYWLWKPYIIKKQLDKLQEGDYLFYCDSGAILINRIEHLVEVLKSTKQDIMGFQLPLLEKQWTKKELFLNMQCDEDYYYNSNQLLASFILIRKSSFSSKFIEEYLNYSLVSENITDYKDKAVYQEDDFIDHRHDQSIFSLLYKRNKLKPFKDISQFGNFPDGYSGFRTVKYHYNKLYKLGNGRYFRVEENLNCTYPIIVFHLRKKNYIIVRFKYIMKKILKKIKR
ncbi:MAG: hypothetical protein E6370_11925 [Clostridiales bacterium]|nr:hypothetical protein [Clostridiales bacterium]MDU6975017.1 hypothetical protein [Clostridiales bacterium]